jgi:lipopolysaccharide assembly outer membrane protein LptD (OstA)
MLIYNIFAKPLFAQSSSTVSITGRQMLIQDQGNVIVSRGNSRVVDDKKNFVIADEMIYDKSASKISAKGNVSVITSSGTVRSDIAVFDAQLNTITLDTRRKRPQAYVDYEGKKGYYVADKMIFFNHRYKRILMQGNVDGKIYVEDEGR